MQTLYKGTFWSGAAVSLVIVGASMVPMVASADSVSFNFESGYATTSVDGQNGWNSTGGFDQSVVDNTYGFASFGNETFRISNATTTDNFDDQTFTAPLVDSVGEATSTSGAFSAGTKQNHFMMQFDIASAASTTHQANLFITVSPERGDGSRMSYLRFEDRADGIHVLFDDVTDAGPVGTGANFNETEIAGGTATTTALDRGSVHTIKMVIDINEGEGNDVVQVYIDNVLVITGTSWEDYYRFDPDASLEQTPRIIRTMLIRASGTPVPGNAGGGFLFDNITLESSTNQPTTPVVPTPTPVVAVSGGGGGGGGGIISQTGDINGDGHVDLLDYNILFSAWGATGSNLAADLNHDGKVDILDFNILVSVGFK